MKRSVVKPWIKVLLFVSCLAILAWMVIEAGPVKLWQTLTAMPWTIAACVAVWGVGYVLNALSFCVILNESDSKLKQRKRQFWEVFRLTVTGYAINYITPFGLLGGEPYRVLALRPQLGTAKATQSVLLYSMMHVASHFCLWILSILWALMTLQEVSADHWMGITVTTVGILSILAIFWYGYKHGIMFRFMQRWVDWPLLNPSLLSSGSFVKALMYELLSRLFNVIEYWLIMQALGFYAFGYGDALLVVAFSSLFANLLFFSPLQMGTREGGIMLALQYLVPSLTAETGAGASLLAVAVALSFATRIREFLWIGLGLLMMRISGFSDNDNK